MDTVTLVAELITAKKTAGEKPYRVRMTPPAYAELLQHAQIPTMLVQPRRAERIFGLPLLVEPGDAFKVEVDSDAS